MERQRIIRQTLVTNVWSFAAYAFYDSDSEVEDTKLEKIWSYAETTVPYFSDKQFQRNFRMSSTTFEDLVQKCYTVRVEHASGHPRMSLEKEVMITVWYLENLESFR